MWERIMLVVAVGEDLMLWLGCGLGGQGSGMGVQESGVRMAVYWSNWIFLRNLWFYLGNWSKSSANFPRIFVCVIL